MWKFRISNTNWGNFDALDEHYITYILSYIRMLNSNSVVKFNWIHSSIRAWNALSVDFANSNVIIKTAEYHPAYVINLHVSIFILAILFIILIIYPAQQNHQYTTICQKYAPDNEDDCTTFCLIF